MSYRMGESHIGNGHTSRGILHIRGLSGTSEMPGLLSLDVNDAGTLTQAYLWKDSNGKLRHSNTLPTDEDSDGTLVADLSDVSGLSVDVINNTGSTIAANALVYISGWDATAGKFEITKAQADDPTTLATLVLDAQLTDGAAGTASITGSATLDTSGGSVDDPVYLSPSSAGVATLTKPTAVGHFAQRVGRVAVKNASGTVQFHLGTTILEKVGSAFLMNGAVTKTQLGTGAVTSGKLSTAAVTASKIASGAVVESKLANDAVVASKIKDSAVVAAKIADNAVGASEIVDSCIIGTKLQSSAVSRAAIADDAIGASQISHGVIAHAHLGINAVENENVANDAIDNAEIADSAVDTSQIADDAIIRANIDDDAVGASEISHAVITHSHIVKSTITDSYLSSDAVARAALGAGAVGASEISHAVIAASHLVSDMNEGMFVIPLDLTAAYAPKLYFPFSATVIKARAFVTTGVTGSSNISVVFKDYADSAMSSGNLSFASGVAAGSEASAVPASNATIKADSHMTISNAGSAATGEVLLTIEYRRI